MLNEAGSVPKELAEKVAAASIWRDTPFDVPENWNGKF